MRLLTYTAGEQDAGKRVETVLQGSLGVSHGLLSRLKRRENGILVNGRRVYSTYILKAGDVVATDVGDEPPLRRLTPQRMDLVIVYEDEDMLVLDKPAHVPVHPTKDPGEQNLEQGLLAYLHSEEYPHFVSRLDKDTTGLMLVTKSGYMHQRMKRLQHTDAFYREYLAVADGVVTPASGTVDAPIGLAEGSSYRHVVRPDGQRSITAYETLSVNNGRTLLRLVPQTGRTHQLRVHMAHIGYPLTGDWLYGETNAEIDRPALHSRLLLFRHPMTGTRLRFTSPLPPDMNNLLL